MDPLLAPLNPAQRDAVRHVDGPLLILAGPGSGKTRVVTHRVAYLLKQGVHASQVLALTFTNKAAAEMRARVTRLAPGERVWMSTFHRFGARLLREHAHLVGLSPNFTIYDKNDARHTLKRVVQAEQIETLRISPERIAGGISAAKNRLITAAEYEPRKSSLLSSVVARVYPAYQERLLASSAVDFDDLLLHIATLLRDHPEVRAELDSRFRYVLVDEYQDTNRAQYVILRALSVDYPNIAATGDPDQSIYGWRGADINNILDFENDYGQAKVVRLEQNYRSTQSILRVADGLIAHNRRRKKKTLFTDNPHGDPVRLVTYADQDEEAADIAARIRKGIDSGERRASDYAVFYRVNALSRAIERAMRRARVPFQMVRGQEFYQRKEIKDVLAYCQLVNNPKDDIAVERTINTPARGIGKKSLDLLNAHAYRYGLPLLEAAREAGLIEGLAKRSAAKVGGYAQVVDRLSALAAAPVEEVMGAVLTESGYRQKLAESEHEEDANRLANIEELLTDARQFDEELEKSEGDPPGGALEHYLERTWLAGETDGWDADSDKVTLMTLHAAKGLEFPVVFMVALEDGILPHERSDTSEAELEEERRLAFVGITRAQQELHLSHAIRRDFRGQRRITVPSSFLTEIPTADIEWLRLASHALELDPAAEADQPHAAPWHEPPTPHAAEPASEESASSWRVAAAAVTTAAELAGGPASEAPGARVSPDTFALDMTVRHPEYGLGKIKSLSGSGKRRAATVDFVLAGQRRIVLAHSPLEPAGGK